MAFLTVHNSSLTLSGPLVEVVICPPQWVVQQLEKEGKSFPAFKATALIDTGASCTCISNSIVEDLKLVSFDTDQVFTAAGLSEQMLYDITVGLPITQMNLLPVQSPCVDLSGQPFQVLLGRDILSMCSLFYNGMDNCFVLHF